MPFAVASGTAALSLSLEVAAIRPDQEVIVPAFTYLATAHAVHLSGAKLRLVDVDADTWNIDSVAVTRDISQQTGVLLPVDQFGLPAAIDELNRTVREVSPTPILIEDAACALGASGPQGRCGKKVSLACFSFHPRKTITTGEGGLVVTEDAHYAELIRSLRDHGRDHRGEFVRIAGNWRMSELAAALGRSQLSRLDSIIAQRRALAERYLSRLANHPKLRIQSAPPGYSHSYQTFAVCLDDAYSRDDVVRTLATEGIETGIATYAVHLERPYCEMLGVKSDAFPVANRLAKQAMALPLHCQLSFEDIDSVCRALERCLDSKR